MQNKMIIQAEASVDAKVPPAQKVNYQKIVLAGKKVMFSKDLNAKLVAGMQDVPDPVQTLVDGVIGVLGLLFKESRNTMPVGPMILAGQSLLMEAMDFLEQAGMLEVTPDLISQVTKTYIETFLPKIGMDSNKMAGVLDKAQGVMNDPQKMAQYQASMGAKK